MTARDDPRGRVTVEDRQVAVPVNARLLEDLERAGSAAWSRLRARHPARSGALAGVAVFLVDDREIARVHAEFFDDPDATDVITFPLGNYGELLVSVETARRQAREFRSDLRRELTLYIVHGLLHLHGFEDRTAAGLAFMSRLQEELVDEVL